MILDRCLPTQLTPEAAKARVEARRWAEECFGAITDKEDFVERVMELGGKTPKPTPERKPMTDQEAKDFGEHKMFFGMYRGSSVRNIPVSYLCHLSDPSAHITEFLESVKRYLMNPNVERRLEDEIP